MLLVHRQCGHQGHAVPHGAAWLVQGSILCVKATLCERFVSLSPNQSMRFLDFKGGENALLGSLRGPATLGL